MEIKKEKEVILKRIRIDDTYFIDIEPRCWALRTEKTRIVKKTGLTKKVKISQGYFTTLESVLNKLIALKVKDKVIGEITLEDLNKAIKETRKEVCDIANRIVI